MGPGPNEWAQMGPGPGPNEWAQWARAQQGPNESPRISQVMEHVTAPIGP